MDTGGPAGCCARREPDRPHRRRYQFPRQRPTAAAVASKPATAASTADAGGATVGLAALLAGKLDVEGKIAVATLSGGNVDPGLFHRLVA